MPEKHCTSSMFLLNFEAWDGLFGRDLGHIEMAAPKRIFRGCAHFTQSSAAGLAPTANLVRTSAPQ
jgi:hypothetical protein